MPPELKKMFCQHTLTIFYPGKAGMGVASVKRRRKRYQRAFILLRRVIPSDPYFRPGKLGLIRRSIKRQVDETT